MLRVTRIEHDGRILDIVPPDLHFFSQQNTYTVIVGKNGVGKSRLLTSIAKAGITQSEHLGFLAEPLHHEPLVIAISTSPFDKFPSLPRNRRKEPGNYRYVGMRGDSIYSGSSAISLISSASRGLLGKILHGANDVDFLEVFKALSFAPQVDFIFKPAFSKLDLADLKYSSEEEPYFTVTTPDCQDHFKVDIRYKQIFQALSTEEKSNASYAMSNVANFFNERKALILEVNLEQNCSFLDGKETHSHIISSIITLMSIGLMRLMDLRLYKRAYGDLSLKRASSGEQCLIVLILGIAGHIEDGSLILIDEPEISLHPRWQEEFMPLLASSFSRYRNCQFIVATHSPQIISRIETDHSFVLSLAEGALYDSKYFKNKSADFQLAELFDAPGLMNEYVSRICFNLIAKIRSRELIDDDIEHEFLKLMKLKNKLTKDDPILNLIISVEELRSYYANN